MRLTALSPSARAPLSSQHSFRYLAETFSLCLPFSKTCFMLGALQPSRCNLLTASLSLSLSAHTYLPDLLPRFLFLIPLHYLVSHIPLFYTLIFPRDPQLRRYHATCAASQRCARVKERGLQFLVCDIQTEVD